MALLGARGAKLIVRVGWRGRELNAKLSLFEMSVRLGWRGREIRTELPLFEIQTASLRPNIAGPRRVRERGDLREKAARMAKTDSAVISQWMDADSQREGAASSQ